MGELPTSRVNPGFAFETIGTDYADTYYIKNSKGRGTKSFKCWICVFICLKTKAVHFELVTSLTTEAFIASLRRFVSRRGKPTEIFSDNDSNYVGACAELKKLLQQEQFQSELQINVSSENIKWHFIPPRSPHMGGMRENAVKSCKHHLKRIMGDTLLTFEEFYTLLVQVESILNSRPISPMSDDPNDLSPLNPSHFLLGRSASSLPDPDLTKTNTRLQRLQLLQPMQQHFWKRWQIEYIQQMQKRNKSKEVNSGLKVNDLVFIKEDNVALKHWLLGRICQLYPGKDGICRVADVKTKNGTVRRAFSKLCVLPMDS